jgi:membrane-associated protease RseP (regulator of RpoE activity)
MSVSTDNLLCRAGWLGVAAAALLLGTSALAQEVRDEVRGAIRADDGDVPAEVPGDYWIGVMCGDVPEVLRWHLELPEDQGVFVMEVSPDLPAAKAGLEKNDVIVAVNDKPIGSPRDLLEAVRAAGDSELSVRYLRGGKEHTVSIQPAKRPDGYRSGPAAGPRQDRRAIAEWIEGLPRGPWSMRMFQPGMVLPPGAKVDSALPDDMSVSVFKKGDEPAKITVEQGDDTWEATEETLDKLPREIRGHVERMLGRAPLVAAPWRGDFDIEMLPPGPGGERFRDQLIPRRRGFSGAAPEGLEQTLERLNRELEQLRKAVEKLEDKAGT